jgi:Ca-activated chloride channel family protein
MMNRVITVGFLGLALAATGCSADDSSDGSGGPVSQGPGATGISQGGAQDFGLFRQILEDGAIPGPGTLDELGFFAEHKLEYPEPACGEDLCMHGLFGVMGNMITGSNCTLIQLGMNSPIDPSKLARPPLHLVIAADVSGSMQGPPMEYMKAGLVEMIGSLKPEDRISLVTYSDKASVVLDALQADKTAELEAAFNGLVAAGATNLYDGLFTALTLAEVHKDPAWQNRVLFVSDGVATAGLVDRAKLKGLAEGYAREGIGITTVGVGTDFDVDVMRDLSEVGAGNFYFLEDPKAVKEVFTEEVKVFLTPVALDASIDVSVGGGYVVRGVYGTNGWTGSEGGGSVNIPSLFLAGRTDAQEPVDYGRRGGGGAILLELVPRGVAAVEKPLEVGSVAFSWKHPVTGMTHSESIQVESPYMPGLVPEEGYFTGPTIEKGFVMLNLFAGFKMATQLAADSDPRTARRVLEALRPNVQAWVDANPDVDVADDLTYVDLFIENLIVVESQTQPYEPADPPNPWPAD